MTIDQFKSGFQHNFHIIVAWRDMDALAHVNNATYFTYMESARVDYLRKYEQLMPMPGEGIGPILAYIDCQFMFPITFPDEVVVGTRITEVGNTSIKLEQEIFSMNHQKTVASGKSVIVLIDYATGEKVRVPDVVREMVRKT